MVVVVVGGEDCFGIHCYLYVGVVREKLDTKQVALKETGFYFETTQGINKVLLNGVVSRKKQRAVKTKGFLQF